MSNPIECGMFSGKAQYGRTPGLLEGVFGNGPGGNGPQALARIAEAPLQATSSTGDLLPLSLSSFVYTEEGLIGFDGYGYYAAVGTVNLPLSGWTWRLLAHDRVYDAETFRRYIAYMPEWAYQQLLAAAGQPLPDVRFWLGDCRCCNTKGATEMMDNGVKAGWSCMVCGEGDVYSSPNPFQVEMTNREHEALALSVPTAEVER